jgi:hypothetical protein
MDQKQHLKMHLKLEKLYIKEHILDYIMRNNGRNKTLRYTIVDHTGNISRALD